MDSVFRRRDGVVISNAIALTHHRSRGQRGNVVPSHSGVFGDQNQALGLRLSHEHTVKGVPVDERELGRQFPVDELHRQFIQSR